MIELDKDDHKFHLVIGRKTRRRLENLPGYDAKAGVSDLIMRIMKLLVPFLEKVHQGSEQQYSKYRLVSADLTEKRDHINLDLPGEVYRFLKVMHQDMNFYSIGQIIRRCLELFLKWAKRYGERVFKVLQKKFNKWKKHKKKYRPSVREELVQLKNMLYHLPGRNRLLTLYKGDYSPLWVFRL